MWYRVFSIVLPRSHCNSHPLTFPATEHFEFENAPSPRMRHSGVILLLAAALCTVHSVLSESFSFPVAQQMRFPWDHSRPITDKHNSFVATYHLHGNLSDVDTVFLLINDGDHRYDTVMASRASIFTSVFADRYNAAVLYFPLRGWGFGPNVPVPADKRRFLTTAASIADISLFLESVVYIDDGVNVKKRVVISGVGHGGAIAAWYHQAHPNAVQFALLDTPYLSAPVSHPGYYSQSAVTQQAASPRCAGALANVTAQLAAVLESGDRRLHDKFAQDANLCSPITPWTLGFAEQNRLNNGVSLDVYKAFFWHSLFYPMSRAYNAVFPTRDRSSAGICHPCFYLEQSDPWFYFGGSLRTVRGHEGCLETRLDAWLITSSSLDRRGASDRDHDIHEENMLTQSCLERAAFPVASTAGAHLTPVPTVTSVLTEANIGTVCETWLGLVPGQGVATAKAGAAALAAEHGDAQTYTGVNVFVIAAKSDHGISLAPRNTKNVVGRQYDVASREAEVSMIVSMGTGSVREIEGKKGKVFLQEGLIGDTEELKQVRKELTSYLDSVLQVKNNNKAMKMHCM